MQDGQPRTWGATDEMDGRQREGIGGHTEVRQEYPEPRREHGLGHASYAPNSHHEAWEAQHGYPHPGTHPHQEHHAGGGDPRAFQYEEAQWPASGWEDDIYAMLPSQMDMTKGTIRFRGSLRNRRGAPVSTAWEQQQHHQEVEDEPQTEAEVLEALDCLRDQPWPLDRRRETKKKLKAKLSNADVKWYSRRPVTKAVRKGGNSLAKLFQANYIWDHVLKRIEGKFGSSVVAFFNFLRALIQLNFLLGLVLAGGVVVPAALLAGGPELQYWGWVPQGESSNVATYKLNDFNDVHDPCYYTLGQPAKFQDCSTNYTNNLENIEAEHKGDVIKLAQDFLQGTGFLEWTILFAGRFPASANLDSHYKLGLAYILSVITVLLISLIFVVYFVAKFFRQLPAKVGDKSTNFPNIIFPAWDYTVREEKAAKTMHISITGEVKTAFDDELFLERKQQRTRNQRITLILTRIAINAAVVVLVCAGWTGIYFLVDLSQKNLDKSQPSQKFLWEYAPTVTVSAFNFVYPLLFSLVVPYEHYRGHTELLITLVRCVFVRLTSLVVLMFTKIIVISQKPQSCDLENPYICWETYLGQQIYSNLLLDMLLHLGMTLVVDVARKSLFRFDNALCKTLGRIEFFVPTHVLDIVYLQSMCWMSVIFAPILTMVSSLWFCLLFGLKLFTVTYTCVPATRVFRASRSSAMFMTILCLAFLLCLVPNGMALLYLRPSSACSPFRGLDYSWQMFTYYVCQMTNASTNWIRWVLFTVDEAVVVGLLFLGLLLLLAYYSSLVGARNGLIRRLEAKLKHTAKDKVFLMSKHMPTQAVSAGS